MRMTIIAITIIISMSVKPRVFLKREKRPGCEYPGCEQKILPLRVGSSIGRLIHTLCIYIEDILAAPAGAFRIVLHTPKTPVPRVGHGIERDPAQKLELGIRRLSRPFDAVDKRLQRLRVSVAVLLLDAEFSAVRHVFVLVDRGVDFMQRLAKLPLFDPPDVRSRYRHRHAAKYEQDRERDDQLDQRHSACCGAGWYPARRLSTAAVPVQTWPWAD